MKPDFPGLWAEAPSTLRREPTNAEVAGGFPCGGLDLQLFNELFYRMSQSLREINYAVTQSGQTPSATNTGQLWAAINKASPAAEALWHYGVASGSPNAIVVSDVAPAISNYKKGLTCLVEMPATFGTGTFATIRIGSLPVVNLLRNDGSGIQANDGPPGGPMLIEYDGGSFRLVGFGRQEVPRIALNPILYVRPDGNDSNDGSANDAGHAFRTPAAALAYGVTRFSIAGTSLVIQLGAPGTYEAPNTVPSSVGTLVLRGDENSQGSYILAGVGQQGAAPVLPSGGRCLIIGLTIRNTGTIAHTFAATNNSVCILQNVDFSCSASNNTQNAHIFAVGGANITVAQGCQFQGNMGNLLQASGGSITLNPTQLRLVDAPNYAVATALAADGGHITALTGASIVGSAAGQRYLATLNATINVSGAGANFFPGTTPGSVQTGGQYAL